MTTGEPHTTHHVEVTIGPLPAESVLIWAESALRNLRAVEERQEMLLPEDVAASFERYVLEWRDLAAGDPTFTWTSDVDVDEVRHLATHWAVFANAARTEDDPTGVEAPPEGARPFYDALVVAMAEVLAVDDETVHFADKFEEVAPAFDAAIPAHLHDDPSELRTRVLLVDDTEDMRLLFRIALQTHAEFEVFGEAANGQEALDALDVGCPDAILLDVMMPIMDGLTALPLLKDLCPDTRITVITTGMTAELRKEAMDKGAFAAVDKQVSLEELKRILSLN